MPRHSKKLSVPVGRLRAIREATEPLISQADLATACGVSQQAVSTWERENTIPEDQLDTVAEVLQVSVRELLSGRPVRPHLAAVPDARSEGPTEPRPAAEAINSDLDETRGIFLRNFASRVSTEMSDREAALIWAAGAQMGIDWAVDWPG